MYKHILLTIAMVMAVNLNIYSQQRLQHLINEFKSSIELPQYYKGEQLGTLTPNEVRNMNIENGILTFQYTFGKISPLNYYSIKIDLRKVETKKGIECDYNAWFAGSIVVCITRNEGTETILVDWFPFSCKSESMRDRIYNELVSMQAPFKPQTKTVSQTNRKKTDLQTRSVSKKSKSGKYAQ